MTPLANTATEPLINGFFDNPAINNDGTVSFKVTGNPNGIVTVDSGGISFIVDTTGPFSAFAQAHSINDDGEVAFEAALGDAGLRNIVTTDGTTTTIIADTAGPFSSLRFPSINEAGVVAFQARLDSGGRGIFTGPDIVADRVIGPGDVLFGRTVTEAISTVHMLNDAGQIAFEAIFDDGQTGIYRANPVASPVPEPSTLLLLGSGLAGLAVWRSRKRTA